MRQGDRVLIRAFGGQALVRRFWEAGARVVYVTDEEGFQAVSSGELTNRVIGFPWEDVFEFRSGLSDGTAVDWAAEKLATRR
jgi:hypothetical protein